jgi:hypothetical protein
VPAVRRGRRRGLAIFASEDAAEDVAPDGFRPHYVGPRDIERWGRAADVQLVALLGLPDELEGSVFELDSFLAVLTGEIG